MRKFTLLIVLLVSLISHTTAHAESSQIPPIIDGRCEEYKKQKSIQIKMDDFVTLYVYQNQHFVWLCYNNTEGGTGLLDLRIEAPGLKKAMNLHISAQLGEWPADKPEMAPTEGTSADWWNHKGWTANTVWFNGYRMRTSETGEEQVANWRNAPDREMQISKERFGRGEWKLRFNIYMLRGKDDKPYDLVYPSKEQFYVLDAK